MKTFLLHLVSASDPMPLREGVRPSPRRAIMLAAPSRGSSSDLVGDAHFEDMVSSFLAA